MIYLTKILLQFIADIAWPLIVFIIVYQFRHPIRGLISKLKNVEVPGIKMETQANQDAELSPTPNRSIEQVLPEGMVQPFSPITMEKARLLIFDEAKLNELEGEDKFNRLVHYTQLIVLQKLFDHTYNYIYGSQLNILKHLNTTLEDTKDKMKYFYDAGAAMSPDLYDTYSYENYLQWMISRDLIELKEDKIQITYTGRDFLKYLIDQGHNLTKNS